MHKLLLLLDSCAVQAVAAVSAAGLYSICCGPWIFAVSPQVVHSDTVLMHMSAPPPLSTQL